MTPSKVSDVLTIERKGPWRTKSNADLSVLFALDYDFIAHKLLSYDTGELSKLGRDIRGLRSYSVENISRGESGAREWHKIRNELVFVLSGSFKWTCVDAYGERSTRTISKAMGLFVPNKLFHTYESLEDNGCLLVIASTLFFPDDPETHDSFSEDAFNQFQSDLSIKTP